MALRRCRRRIAAFSLMVASFALDPSLAKAIEYQIAPSLQITSISMELRSDSDGQFCYITVAVKNESNKDQLLEVALDSDDGYSVITYSGGPDRKATKAGLLEKFEFKTILNRLPKDIMVSVRPAD